MTAPETRYARSGKIRIAYQVVGEGPLDLVFVPGFVSNVELWWEMPEIANFLTRLAAFSRLIVFDKRGTGLSDRDVGIANLEERMDDVRAVMDAAGSERAALLGISEGGALTLLFAATYPQRAQALVFYGSYARHPKLVTAAQLKNESSRLTACGEPANSPWGAICPVAAPMTPSAQPLLAAKGKAPAHRRRLRSAA